MLLETTLETFQALDNAYEAIAKEVKEARGAGAAPPWRSIVRERPRRPAGMSAADIECAKHGGTPHGIAFDGLTDHLASEMAVWTRLCEHSKTAREVLGVSNVLPQSGSRLGALVYMDEDRGFRVRFAGSAGVLSPSSDTTDLWVEGLIEATSFRPKHELSDPHLFYSREEGKARRWSFSDVKKGYEEYLRAHQKPADETALLSLTTCPTPRLLGGLTEHNRRAFKEQVPLALSEAWLFGSGQNQNGSLASLCDACRFGLGPWMCGHRDMLSRAEAADPLHYNEAARLWLDRIRDRKEPKKSVPIVPEGQKAEPTTNPKPISDRPGFWTGDMDTSPPGDAGMIDLPERDVTRSIVDQMRSTRPVQPRLNPAGVGGVEARREPVSVRLESTEFHCDDVEISELLGREAIGQLYSFQVDIVCPDNDDVTEAKMLGAQVSLVFERANLLVRRISGMISEVFDRLETETEMRSFRIVIVPRLWRSTLVETQECYLDTNVPDLISQKLGLVGLTGPDVQMRLSANYPVRELIVQYKETDVAFVSRLCEHLGISFFFDQQADTDSVIFTDSMGGFPVNAAAPVVKFRPRGDRVDVYELEAFSKAFPASFVMQDYNYRTPTLDLTSVVEAPLGFGGGVVEYGSHVKTPAEAAALAQVRSEERQVASRHYRGKSDLAELHAGTTVTLDGHSRLEGKELLITEVIHRAKQTVKMFGSAGENTYVAEFRATDKAHVYRPVRQTPRPKIHGVLTAVVEPNPTGELGESARIDSDGRYTVKFYFDAGDVAGRQKHSRPVRMIQAHAGPNYGIHFPLKPGVEVLLVFMDGDPDRPMIVGAVPNPITPSPVVEDVSLMNRIETTSGLIIEMRDAVPPLAK